MTSELESIYTLNTWSVTERELIVRLVPDFVNTEIAEPVVTVSVSGPLRTAEAEAGLQSYAGEWIVDIRAVEQTVEIWGEYDDTPLTLAGKEVKVSRSAYSLQDLAKAIQQLESQLSSSQESNMRLRNHMAEVESFVVDLLNRAQAKKAMSSRSTSTSEAQIDALSRVLSHIRGA